MNKKLLMSFVFVLAFVFNIAAQDRTVSGKVTSSEDGSMLPGVSVKVKGTTRGVTTDGDGNYKISVASTAKLSFSFVGFTSSEIAVNNSSVIDVKLVAKNGDLEEVVVTGYGGALAKRD